MKLSVELIQMSPQFINPVRDREIDLRGHKIPIIENLGATLDQFDTIDLSDNDIRKLDGFPLLNRLKCLLLNNNRITRIAEDLEEFIPNLESVILTNNLIQELGDLDPLITLKNLRVLSLLRNPVASKKHYREYVIYKLPQLRLLDFRKIKMKEKEEAQKLFKSKKGKQLEKEIAKKAKTFVPGQGMPEVSVAAGPSPAEIQAIKDAIANAGSLEEIERLNQMLKAGQIPGKQLSNNNRAVGMTGDEEMETDGINGQ